jgi:hypothetical protein
MKMTILKLGISCFAIGVLVTLTDTSAVWEQLRKADGLVIAASIGAIWLAQAISSLRLQWILRAEGAAVPFGFLFGTYMIGMFANALLPTSIGGDIVKTYDIYRRTKDLSVSITSVFIERFSGLLVLLVLSWVGIGAFWGGWSSAFFWVWIASSGAACAIVMVICKREFIERVLFLIEKGALAKPVRLARECLKILVTYKNRKFLVARLIIISIPVQFLSILVYGMIAISLGLEIPFVYFLFGVPLIIILSLLPISLGGLGVREAAGVTVFCLAGVSAEGALSLSLLYTTVTYLSSFLGGIFLILRKTSIREVSEKYKTVSAKAG